MINYESWAKMILIRRTNPSKELSKLLEDKNNSTEWIDIDSKDTKKMRDAFDKATRIKALTKEELFAAQHGLCAYCMAEISLTPTKEEEKNKKIKIEHYIPLSKAKNHVFDFNNYLLTCTGGDHENYNKAKEAMSCDSKKGEKNLTVDPTNPEHISSMYYQDDGMIKFNNQADKELTKKITNDLNITLGLNGSFYMNGNNNKYDTRTKLVERRKEAYQKAFDLIKYLKDNQKFTPNIMERLIKKEEVNPHEFSGVILFVYRMLLSRGEQQRSETEVFRF